VKALQGVGKASVNLESSKRPREEMELDRQFFKSHISKRKREDSPSKEMQAKNNSLLAEALKRIENMGED
jgi:hypothetical protein